jgi:integrase
MRPEEALALERREVDRAAAVATIERVYTQGTLKPCAKTSRQRRRVPLRQRVQDALEALPPRMDSTLVFPAARGGHVELGKWRERVWKPALVAAGIPHRRIYDLRHTYATWALAAGVSVFTLSRRMGTSLAMIDATYGHLARRRRGAGEGAPGRLRRGATGRKNRCLGTERASSPGGLNAKSLLRR